MFKLFRSLYIRVYAWAVKRYRTQQLVRAFKVAHAQELTEISMAQMPVVMARQQAEMRAVQAGKIDAIVDRKSWQWPFLPSSVQRLSTPLMKSTPYNLRRMSRTPVPRRAINLIKGAIISQPWDVRPLEGTHPIDGESVDDQEERIKIARRMFNHPNGQDSFQSFVEQGLEDMLVLGAYVAELGVTIDPERPVKMWPVNVESIRLFTAWQESTPDMPHYAQMTGLKGERGALLFYDDQLLYIRDNPSTDNPFGLGKMEVAFQSVNDFLGVQGMSGRSGTDQIHKTWLWWEAPQPDSSYQIVRRHIQNDLEGQAKISIIGGMKKPEVVEVKPTTVEDLLLPWQEILIRMIANAFDLSAMALGIEHDVNRAIGEVLDDKDFRSAVVPIARRLQEAFTRRVLHDKLGWYDLEYAFLNLDDPDAQTKMTLYSQMYSTNSIVPNEIRKGMGFIPWTLEQHPLAELTMAEMMVVNLQAAAMQQNTVADAAQGRQQDMMEQQQGMLPPPQSGVPPQLSGRQPGSAPGAPGGQQQAAPKVSAPAKLTLPKFPVVHSSDGRGHTARDLARMPVNQIQDALSFSGQRASYMLSQMDNQESGILEQLSEEVREFFDQQLQDERSKPNKPISPKLLKKWAKVLKTRVKTDDDRSQDYTEWLYRVGKDMGKAGHLGGAPAFKQSKKAGKPGQPPKNVPL